MVQTSLDKEGKVEKLLITPTPNASAKAPVSMSKLGLKQLNPDRDINFKGKATTMSNIGVANGRSPFRTPPSLSYRVDKVFDLLIYSSLQPSIGYWITIVYFLKNYNLNVPFP